MRWAYIILVVFLMSRCAIDDHIRVILDDAESIMADYPRKALEMVRTIDVYKLRSNGIKARYALLYSMALDKNYIDETDDSLIRIATDYYLNKGGATDKFLSLYYLGRVQQNSGNHIQAMLTFLEAEYSGLQTEDSYLLGLLYTQMASIHSKHYDYKNALFYNEKAYLCYSKTQHTAHINYAIFDMGVANYNLQQYEKSLELYNSALEMAVERKDTALQSLCFSNLALTYSATSDFDKVKSALEQKADNLNKRLSLKDCCCMAEYYTEAGKIDSAKSYIEQARLLINNRLDSAHIYYASYFVNEKTGNFREAAGNLRSILAIQDSVTRGVLHQSLVVAQRDFFQEKSELNAYKLKITKVYWIAAIIIIVLSVSLVIYYLRNVIKANNIEAMRYMEKILEFQASKERMLEQLRELFKERFALVDELCSTYYERHTTKSEQIAIFNKVKGIIESFATDKSTKKQLEDLVNLYNENVIEKLKTQIPDTTDSEIELFCFLFAGFSPCTISIFINDRIQNVYTRKSRLKKKIAKSNVPDKERFLILLS